MKLSKCKVGDIVLSQRNFGCIWKIVGVDKKSKLVTIQTVSQIFGQGFIGRVSIGSAKYLVPFDPIKYKREHLVQKIGALMIAASTVEDYYFWLSLCQIANGTFVEPS